MLQERGFQVEGFEGDPAGLWLARERSPAVWTGDWDAISHILRGRQFDCIVSDQVFEHTLRPGHFLSELRGLLAPEGKLIFRLPNEGSLRRNLEVALARLKGRDHTRFYFVDQRNYFNSRALRLCFESNGYRVLSLKQDLSPQGFIMGKLLKTMTGHATSSVWRADHHAWTWRSRSAGSEASGTRHPERYRSLARHIIDVAHRERHIERQAGRHARGRAVPKRRRSHSQPYLRKPNDCQLSPSPPVMRHGISLGRPFAKIHFTTSKGEGSCNR